MVHLSTQKLVTQKRRSIYIDWIPDFRTKCACSPIANWQFGTGSAESHKDSHDAVNDRCGPAPIGLLGYLCGVGRLGPRDPSDIRPCHTITRWGRGDRFRLFTPARLKAGELKMVAHAPAGDAPAPTRFPRGANFYGITHRDAKPANLFSSESGGSCWRSAFLPAIMRRPASLQILTVPANFHAGT